MKNIKNTLENILKVLKLVIPIAPLRMTIYLILTLPGAILPTVMLYMQRRVVDNAVNFDTDLSLTYYMKPILMLIGTYMILKLFELVSKQYMEFGYFRYVFIGLDNQIHKKSAKISLEYYDNAEYYQIVQNAKWASMFLVFTANLVIMLLALIINLLSVGGYLSSINPLLIIFVILVSVPVIIEKIQGTKYHSSLVQDTVQPARRKEYAFELLSDSNQKKEIAHHGSGDFIANKYLEACRELNTRELKHIHQVGYHGLIFAGIKSFFHCMATILMVWLLVTDSITIGGFSVLLTSFASLTNTFTQMFSHAGEILQTSVMSASFFTLMELEIKDGSRDMKDSEEFAKLEHVSYRYPNGTDFALKDISLSIKKGERIAIVGENGVGKTTLAKMLSGFLIPTEGCFEMGGVPRSDLREDSIFEQISAVYQDFGHYKLTLAENVFLSDTVGQSNSLKEPNRERVCEALKWAGILLCEYPEEMLLGKEFGGTDISGGQWQRLALARSYYRHRPILFFDEPTAAIDPLEEMALYEKLNRLAKERTVILVTHRLGAVRTADKIILMDAGTIAEVGSFEQLMEQKERFYHIWKEQVKWY